VKFLNGAVKNCLITDMATLIIILDHIKSEAYNFIGALYRYHYSSLVITCSDFYDILNLFHTLSGGGGVLKLFYSHQWKLIIKKWM
jgi:hypothetical protein